MVWTVLPLKNFANSKQRLSSVLSKNERSHLFHLMVEDVLDVLVASSAVEQIVIVSDDPSAELLAKYYGVLYWSESSLQAFGLNDVVDAAADKLTTLGVRSILVVHGDLPLITVDEVQKIISFHNDSASPTITIVHDTLCEGSNCVMATPPNAIPFQYGENSFDNHQVVALQRSIKVNVLSLSGAGCDIDNPADLQFLSSVCEENTRTLRYLHEKGISERLQTILIDEKLESDNRYDENLWNLNVDNNKQLNSDYKTLMSLFDVVLAGEMPKPEQCLVLANPHYANDLFIDEIMTLASKIRDKGFHNVVTYSRKVFIPLTHLCRDICHYCTFAQAPSKVQSPYMSVDDVLATVRAGVQVGCKEVLFTLGEKPELRYSAARNALKHMGFESTLEYVAYVAKLVFDETGILPHINAGCMSDEEISMLRPVSASMGIMLESTAERLTEKGMPHYGSPDKIPAIRLQTIESAGKAKVPFTSGILVGIGETRHERIESLLALRELHLQYGHLQEVIIQNFRAKADTKMSCSPEPDLKELLWTIAVARLIFGSSMSIQAPPNLSPGVLPKLIASGLNDWGGVSPITPDYVNPEAPWPHIETLERETIRAGKFLHERLTIYPRYAIDGKKWLHENLQATILRMIDAEGFPRVDDWSPGELIAPPKAVLQSIRDINIFHVSDDVKKIIALARSGGELSEGDLIRLFQARGNDFAYVCQQANQYRQELNGDRVSYVVNRNINYTNICYFKCQFCAFSKGKLSENLRGRPYKLNHDEISKRCEEGWMRGATEVCMQGGIHPEYTGDTYLEILKTVKNITPNMHIHAFSPLEVWQGAETLDISLADYLAMLKSAGLNTLPGTAAEILDDEVRAVLCPDKINTEQWLLVMEEAHRQGFKTTATIMYGHIEKIGHWARHLLKICQLQKKTGGFTEFVPLPFVHMQAPMYLKGRSRKGPTFREALLMHAVSRLVLSPYILNIQASWVKMGKEGVIACLDVGANDLGGTLMNESITRAAGSVHGQECTPQEMERLIELAKRQPRQRSTLYTDVPRERIIALDDIVNLVDAVYMD